MPLDGHLVTVSESDLGPAPRRLDGKALNPAAIWLVAPDSSTQVDIPLRLSKVLCCPAWAANVA